MAVLSRFDAWRRSELFAQLVRFAIAGGITTALYTLVYSPLAKYRVTSEQVANLAGYLASRGHAVMLGRCLQLLKSNRCRSRHGNAVVELVASFVRDQTGQRPACS